MQTLYAAADAQNPPYDWEGCKTGSMFERSCMGEDDRHLCRIQQHLSAGVRKLCGTDPPIQQDRRAA
jgi:hypothetical protein